MFVDALASMTKMAQYINEMKRKHEHAVRIQEIQSILYGWDGADLTTLGELAIEVCTTDMNDKLALYLAYLK